MTRPVKNWILALGLDASARDPLFLRISRAISADIRRGRLRPGTRLPGSRTLARSLGVHRNTVLAAYGELASEGWIETSRTRGTFVSGALPETPVRAAPGALPAPGSPPQRPGFDLPAGPVHRDHRLSLPPANVLTMGGGVSDMRLVPVAKLARAYRRALKNNAASVLSYGYVQGDPCLRAALASMLTSARGLVIRPDDILVTQGSQMALDLIGRTLIRPGDVIAVESLGYAPAWEAFRQYGARLVPVPVDRGGMDIAALARIADESPLRAVYITPHHQYPTTTILTAGRRMALLALAQRLRMAVIEDDYDHEFHYEGRPTLPLASADPAGVVIYVGTLAKILAPGLRLGYVVAPRQVLERLTAQRFHVDRQGEHSLEQAVAELIDTGELQRHAHRSRRIYRARRDLLVDLLRRELGDALSFAVPPGGMAIWARVAKGIDADAWAARALACRLLVYTARRFAFDGRPRPFIRLGFAALDEAELRVGVQRLRQAL